MRTAGSFVTTPTISLFVKLSLRFVGAIFLAQIAQLKTIQPLDYRGMHTTQFIQLHKSSPAYAALEDSRTDWGEVTPTTVDGAILLTSGSQFIAPKTEAAIHYVRLDGLTITQPKPTVINTQPPSLLSTSGDLLPMQERKRKLAAYYQNQDWHTPTVTEKARQLIALAAEEKSDNQRWITSKIEQNNGQASKIYIAKQKPKQKSPSRSDSPSLADLTKKFNEDADTSADSYLAKSENPFGISSVEAAFSSNLVVNGTIQLVEGLAYTGPGDHLSIYHVHDGIMRTEGQVWLQEGRFEISLAKLQGYLLAELRSPQGELRGYGEIDLYRFPHIPYHQREIKDLKMVLRPTIEGVVAELISAESFDEHKILSKAGHLYIDSVGAEVLPNNDGIYQNPDFVAGSSFVFRAEEANHWGSMVVGISGVKESIRMFPDDMMEALLSLTVGPDAEAARQQAIIWGRVVVDGQPVSGATVELAGDETIRPIYFNSYIPDSKLRATTANGLFAFVMVTPGIQAVRAFYNGHYLPAEVIPAQAHHVSYVELQGLTIRSASVAVYDALNGDVSLSAKMNIIGTDIDIPVGHHGAKAIQFPGGSGLMMVDADAGQPYEVIRVTMDRKARHLNLPMVNSQWLQDILVRKKANVSSDTGIIIGFSQEENFEVSLDTGGSLHDSQIIYFDQRGEALFNGKGVKGGGFIIYNVTPGLRTLTVTPTQISKMFSQVVIVGPEVVNVIN